MGARYTSPRTTTLVSNTMCVWFAPWRPFSLSPLTAKPVGVAVRKLVRESLGRPTAPLLVPAADDDRRVVAAEPERVRDGDVQVRNVARLVRDIVEVTVRIGIVVVDRRRRLAVDDRLHGEHGLDRAGRAEAVAGRALRRRDGELRLRVVLAERL